MEPYADSTGNSDFKASDSLKLRIYDLLISSSPNIIIGLGRKSKVVIFSDSAQKLTGYSPSEMLGREWISSVIPADIREKTQAVFDEAYETGKVPLIYENPIIIKSGEKRTISWTSTMVPDEAGKVFMIIGIGQDVTMMKRDELAVSESESKFRSLFDFSDSLIISLGLDGKMLDINQSTLDFVGMKKEELVGRHFSTLKFLDQASVLKLSSALEKSLTGQKTVISHSMIDRLGRKRTLQTTSSLIRLSGRPVGFMFSSTDVSDLADRTEQVEAANIELKRMDDSKNEFISVTAHELKTPLASIHGFASLLQKKDAITDPKQIDYYLNIIMQDSERLKQLIDDILDLSRLDLGTMKFTFEQVSVKDIFADVIREMYPLATAKGLKIRAEISQALPETMITDRSRLTQILINLVSNAIKYTDKRDKTINLLASRKDDKIIFSVQDEGVGIDAKQFEKLFKRFSQIDSSYTRKVGGSGLGLAISRGIVTALGGSIWLESEPGKGSVFSFDTPLSSKVELSKELELKVLLNKESLTPSSPKVEGQLPPQPVPGGEAK